MQSRNRYTQGSQGTRPFQILIPYPMRCETFKMRKQTKKMATNKFHRTLNVRVMKNRLLKITLMARKTAKSRKDTRTSKYSKVEKMRETGCNFVLNRSRCLCRRPPTRSCTKYDQLSRTHASLLFV